MEKLTPMMQQYFDIKKNYPDCLVFYRLGDFYEMFYDDALTASETLGITLTGRDCGQKEKAPMCGVPYHSADGYIAKLIENGFKVAICEQVEDPKKTKKIVKREVVRVVTIGTSLDPNVLDEGKNNFLVCIYEGEGFGLSYVDISTGEFFTTETVITDETFIIDEITRLRPKEIIVNEDFKHRELIKKIFDIKTNVFPDYYFNEKNANKRICDHFNILNLVGLGLENDHFSAISSGALLEYLSETQKNSLAHILKITKYGKNKYMLIDSSSRKNLELTETMKDKSKKGSLLWVLDSTKTPMGARLLRKWVDQPLVVKDEIEARLDMLEEYKNDIFFREELKEILKATHDFERLLSKIVYKTANGKDIINLRDSIKNLPKIKALISKFSSKLSTEILYNFDELIDIYENIEKTIAEEPPFTIREGGIFKDGFNTELDTYRKAKAEGSSWLLELEDKEKKLTGIKNLKIRYNRIFGYYIEITKSNITSAPERYIRRQTLANCERYTIEELKKIEDAILGAESNINELEYDLFMKFIEDISLEIGRIQEVAQTIATIDAVQSLAEVADKNDYVKPEITEDDAIQIFDGRHPVVEKLANETFVPNDILMDMGENRVHTITGPNMAGKSTFMRQTALIVLMAQMGSFVPAIKGSISIVDKIFTRIGASDDLSSGQSTFMVEMSEVANILNSATKNSFIILDEIGRGTGTSDGFSIAWAVLEYIAQIIGAKTLCSTHYYELTDLEGQIPGIKNFSMAIQERGGDIVFLRKIVAGGTSKSYGIHVAKLAGVPQLVLDRSDEIFNTISNKGNFNLKNTDEKSEIVSYNKKKKPFDSSKYQIFINELVNMDVDSLSPREALQALYELKLKSNNFKE